MKRTLFSLVGVVLGAVLCIAITWLTGQIFGQLYQGEDGANRNFGIFMLAFLTLTLAGGATGFLLSRRKT